MTAQKKSLRGLAYASMFGALTAIGAFIMIPVPPVPITMQTLFVILSGTLLGGYLGALSQVVYILLGVIGLPVFTGGKAGIGVFLGPTGGYLIGFVIGAYIIGKLVSLRRDPGILWLMGAMTAGITIVYTCGIIQLMLIGKLSFFKAIAVGLLPPLPGDVIKIIVSSFVCQKIRPRIFNKI